MNIAFFLTPKREILYETEDATMKEVIDKMECSTYTAIPLIDNNGKYIGAITEGDLLWKLKNTPGLSIDDTPSVSISDINRHTKCDVVSINANIEDLIELAKNQNFIPVEDDEGIFIGIIKRSDIINYCSKVLLKANKSMM